MKSRLLLLARLVQKFVLLLLVSVGLMVWGALIAAGCASYIAADQTPPFAFGWRWNTAYVSVAGGRVQVFSELDHETILSDKFAADKSVRPRIISRRKFAVPGLQFRSMQWGRGASPYWDISVASPLLLIATGAIAAGTATYCRKQRAPARKKPSARKAGVVAL